MTEQSLHYGTKRIAYRVVFVRDRNVAIHVYPDGRVRVDAPVGAELRIIKTAVQKRARWISNHLEQIDRQAAHVLPREYASGESHLYLGRRHALRVVSRKNVESSVRLIRGRLEVTTSKADHDAVRSLLWGWYTARAREVFQRRLDQMVESLTWVQTPPRWKLLTMKKQWGSCSPKGLLNLNPHLVKAPTACIDYVMLHELCHLRFHNHSRSYYRLLSTHMPGWEPVKGRLDGMAGILLNR